MTPCRRVRTDQLTTLKQHGGRRRSQAAPNRERSLLATSTGAGHRTRCGRGPNRSLRRSPPPASIICIDTSSFCLNPQNVKERKSHERKQHISRGVSRQQDEPATDSMECPARSGATREAKREIGRAHV